jgi:hypothetical protein
MMDDHAKNAQSAAAAAAVQTPLPQCLKTAGAKKAARWAGSAEAAGAEELLGESERERGRLVGVMMHVCIYND